MKKQTVFRAIRLSALLLALSLLLTGCFGVVLPVIPQTTAGPEPTEKPTAPITTEAPTTVPTDAPTESPTVTTTEAPPPTTEPFDPDDEAMIRWQNAGEKDYLPDEPVALVPFSRMEYVRPDVEALCADFDALIAKAKDNDDAEALLADYYGLYTRYISFHSRDALANIRYSQDTTDRYYKDEYDYCENEGPNL